VKRLQKCIKSCSDNYSKDCYILKLDISGYFMSIDKNILFKKVKETLVKRQLELKCDYIFIIDLIKKVIFNDCKENFIFKGKKSDYI